MSSELTSILVMSVVLLVSGLALIIDAGRRVYRARRR